MAELDLDDLVRNGTMSAGIAATLTIAAREMRSFVVFAVPRLAGKSTVLEAMLARRPGGVTVRTVKGGAAEMGVLERAREGGYLQIAEISHATTIDGYIWGAPVRRVFKTLAAGYSLAVALHAPGVKEAFDIISHGNGVPDEDASRIQLSVYVRSLGAWQAPTGRRIAEVHEIEGVVGGVPTARLLHRWDEATDRFVEVEAARILGSAPSA